MWHNFLVSCDVRRNGMATERKKVICSSQDTLTGADFLGIKSDVWREKSSDQYNGIQDLYLIFVVLTR